MEKWRVGTYYNLHVYEGNRPVAAFHTPEDAQRAVDAVNRNADVDRSRQAVEAWLNAFVRFGIPRWAAVQAWNEAPDDMPIHKIRDRAQALASQTTVDTSRDLG